MAFACALEIPEDEQENLVHALEEPVWDVFLGRKSCVPTEFVFQGRFDSEEAALLKAEDIAAGKKRIRLFTVLEGAHHDEGGEVMTINDVPTCFGLRKRYRDRQVTVIP
jgi:CRISPR system Cascade subunit CasD